MEIKYKLYPYPVLAYFTDDYKEGSSFSTSIKFSQKGYNIDLAFHTELINDDLERLISSKQAYFVYHLECSQTGFRKVATTTRYDITVSISQKDVNGLLQICPFIIAEENIENYSSESFNDDYNDEKFSIEQGYTLAVGKQVNVSIQKDWEDLAYTPSIFSIVRDVDTSHKEMQVEIGSQKIVVKLPAEDYYNYKMLMRAPQLQSTLNALTIVPTLIYVLEKIHYMDLEERREFEGNVWYRSLKSTLWNRFQIDIEADDFLEGDMDSLKLAQALINNPMSDGLKYMTENSVDNGEEEE